MPEWILEISNEIGYMLFNDVNRVLVLAPHTDDGGLGMGGTIHKLLSMGKQVIYVAFSTAGKSLPAGMANDTLKVEVKHATGKLGIEEQNLIIYDYEVRELNYARQQILEALIALRGQLHPDIVFVPSLHDVHQDHQTIAQEAVRAFKNTTLLGYELIWNNLTFNTQCFVELSEDDLRAKQEALHEYHSQHGRMYMSDEFVRSLAVTRGVQAGVPLAEVFEVIRLFL